MSYSIVERAKCAAWFEWTKSIITVQRKFRDEFRKDAPHKQTIHKWHAALMETGSVKDTERHRSRTTRTDEATQHVEKLFEEKPTTSIRHAAHELNISPSSIHRTLHEHGYHPYKLQVVQELMDEDLAARIEFARDELERINADAQHLPHLAFSDESHFHLDGTVNRHNCRYWARENPAWVTEQSLHSPRTTAWAAIWRGGIIGPFFVDENITSERYLTMLKEQFWPAVVRHHLQHDMLFMQDGAPPHWGKQVRLWLDQRFPGRWMGRDSPNMPWPPRSPDLTPCDFFMWGFIKSKVYDTSVQDIEELKLRIQRAFSQITGEMRVNVIAEYQGRLLKVLENNGSHIETHNL